MRHVLAPPIAQPPPDLPNIEASPALAQYLRTFSLWAKNGLAGKPDTRTAQIGVLLQASDAPAGTTPKVFLLQVKTDGTVVATPVAIGGATLI